MTMGPIAGTVGVMPIPIRASRSSVAIDLVTSIRSPWRNIEGQPMTSTSRKPSSRRYAWVVSPRTPIDGDRSRTALANALTASSNGRTAPGSCDRANWTPTPRTVTGIVSRSMTRVRRMRLSMYERRKAFASGIT